MKKFWWQVSAGTRVELLEDLCTIDQDVLRDKQYSYWTKSEVIALAVTAIPKGTTFVYEPAEVNIEGYLRSEVSGVPGIDVEVGDVIDTKLYKLLP